MFALIFIAVAVLTLIYFWVQKRYRYWSDKGFLQVPSEFPFGALKGVGTKVASCIAFDGYYKSFKGRAQAVGVYFFFSPVVMITDIELLKNIFIRDFASFHDRGLYYNKEDDPLSANLVRS